MDNLAVHEDMGQPMYIMWNNSKYSDGRSCSKAAVEGGIGCPDLIMYSCMHIINVLYMISYLYVIRLACHAK